MAEYVCGTLRTVLISILISLIPSKTRYYCYWYNEVRIAINRVIILPPLVDALGSDLTHLIVHAVIVSDMQ